MGHASTLLHGLQHELSIFVGHAWDYGNNGRVSDLHEEGRCATLLHGLQHKLKALLQAKGDRVTVAGGTHPSHDVVITCNYGIAETAGAWSGLLAQHACASNEQTCGKLVGARMQWSLGA